MAPCAKDCPLYNLTLSEPEKAEDKQSLQTFSGDGLDFQADANDPMSMSRPRKEVFKEQFEEAMEVVRRKLDEDAGKHDIVRVLNEGGFKTRTGKKWTYAILNAELRKLDKTK